METLNFSDALAQLRAGKRITRGAWQPTGDSLQLFKSTRAGSLTLEFSPSLNEPEPTYVTWIGQMNCFNTVVPWRATDDDLLAEDWQVVE